MATGIKRTDMKLNVNPTPAGAGPSSGASGAAAQSFSRSQAPPLEPEDTSDVAVLRKLRKQNQELIDELLSVQNKPIGNTITDTEMKALSERIKQLNTKYNASRKEALARDARVKQLQTEVSILETQMQQMQAATAARPTTSTMSVTSPRHGSAANIARVSSAHSGASETSSVAGGGAGKPGSNPREEALLELTVRMLESTWVAGSWHADASLPPGQLNAQLAQRMVEIEAAQFASDITKTGLEHMSQRLGGQASDSQQKYDSLQAMIAGLHKQHQDREMRIRELKGEQGASRAQAAALQRELEMLAVRQQALLSEQQTKLEKKSELEGYMVQRDRRREALTKEETDVLQSELNQTIAHMKREAARAAAAAAAVSAAPRTPYRPSSLLITISKPSTPAPASPMLAPAPGPATAAPADGAPAPDGGAPTPGASRRHNSVTQRVESLRQKHKEQTVENSQTLMSLHHLDKVEDAFKSMAARTGESDLKVLLRRILLHEEVSEGLRKTELDSEMKLNDLAQVEAQLAAELKELQITGDDLTVRKAMTSGIETRLAEARGRNEEKLKALADLYSFIAPLQLGLNSITMKLEWLRLKSERRAGGDESDSDSRVPEKPGKTLSLSELRGIPEAGEGGGPGRAGAGGAGGGPGGEREELSDKLTLVGDKLKALIDLVNPPTGAARPREGSLMGGPLPAGGGGGGGAYAVAAVDVASFDAGGSNSYNVRVQPPVAAPDRRTMYSTSRDLDEEEDDRIGDGFIISAHTEAKKRIHEEAREREIERRRAAAKAATAAPNVFADENGQEKLPGFLRGTASSQTAAEAGHAKRQNLAKVDAIVGDSKEAEEPPEDTRRRGRRNRGE